MIIIVNIQNENLLRSLAINIATQTVYWTGSHGTWNASPACGKPWVLSSTLQKLSVMGHTLRDRGRRIKFKVTLGDIVSLRVTMGYSRSCFKTKTNWLVVHTFNPDT